ncbi:MULTISPECIES: MerR family transcriptional regulator [unclassified Ensifer]|uniref:MerR family transcriptional regulator n=1 Tax=unclassified Ensifer TaxID=2633371 RepID=UPI0008131F18|nr:MULTISPECIES: MerR family transcriptional regulator [unclassified Ensifer]OCP00852.1 MerR family transcriptional regulator [Ensifer sp. LC13]OCP01667.1 MerR family transcriptional regulator [Ensifer sp. LC11]OCP07294.1 MerR family transcriptional regulator [Ensifer sp. LC14]OCP29722.1 MerR family transcriptional regulator [Ensifer sp. LC499]
MDDQIYSIGELSKLSGIPVRRLRFYSDKGLLPPSARTQSGYRMYSGAELARLDLVLALREAGVSLAEIQKILANRTSFADVLALRLRTLETEIRSKRRIAAALRVALKLHEPSPMDLRRLWTVTRLSKTEFRAALKRFYDDVAGDAPVDAAWKRKMMDAGTPDLPEDPTPEQIDAWTELMDMLSDKAYAAEMRAYMSTLWTAEFDAAAYAQAADATFARVRAAIENGLGPQSTVGREIAADWLARSAQAMRRAPDKDFLDWQLEQYRKHHARSARYQELMAVLQGQGPQAPTGREWSWIIDAMKQLF